MKKKVLFAAVCLSLLLAAGGGLAWKAATKETDGGRDGNVRALFDEPKPVLLEEVGISGETEARAYPVTTGASREAPLSFRVSGPLVQVRVQPGNEVKQGDVLLEIDPRDFRDNITVLEAQLSGALAGLEKARLDFERATSLLAEKVISQASFDAAKSAHDSSAASVKNIRAQLAIARHQLEDTKLRAPFNGIVAAKLVENHQVVAAGSVVMTMFDLSDLEVLTNIPENEIAHKPLVPGETASVEFTPLPGRRFQVFLKEWSTAPDPLTRTYSVTFRLPAPDGAKILPGMTGQLFWSGQKGENAEITVPEGALVAHGNGETAVWIFDPATSTATRRHVRTGGVTGGGRIRVLEGLSGGEQFVAAGAVFVVEGMRIRPLTSK